MSGDILRRSFSRTAPGDIIKSPPIEKRTLHLSHLPERTDIQPSFPRTPGSVDPNNPPWPAFRGYHTYSFANATMGVRLPTILSKAIQDVLLTVNTLSAEYLIKDLLACVKRMEKLKAELEGNGVLRPIKDDGEADVALWNKEVAKYFLGKDFMNATWLFAEAYKYRRLRECFTLSEHFADYDVFFRQKCDTFSRSNDAVFELSGRFGELFCHDQTKKQLSADELLEKEKLMFHELTQICLWGNSTDLSLLINMTEEQIKSLQSTGGDHLAETEKNILGNHLEQLWELVKKLKDKVRDVDADIDEPYGITGKRKGGRIDFVLDNAGFELYCDCVYADWLVQLGFASQIRFHGKRYPWFVSDVTKKDWEWLLNTMVYGHLFPEASSAERESLRKMGLRWKEYERQGIWVYEQHPFWCTGYTFWDLHAEAPDLFLDLSKSDLVIFKGDLNHRKLTYDCAAPASTPFETAIGPMSSAAGAPPVCSIRTIKSDVVVGLGPNGEDIAAKLDKNEDGWKISGKYAVILLSQGRPGEQVRFA
ncbi:protein-glutamate O-methyltransferase family protein [Phanerochaete sordida]|uniref:Sugar phosphate phosphatase n=1 Tax=Phanerochaete sordida TaxID=48140 RepID=A0A9P3G5Q1_9APHY|nr:protein-glutamate O-methyltransferase family protein [Phanerochaete sordida]